MKSLIKFLFGVSVFLSTEAFGELSIGSDFDVLIKYRDKNGTMIGSADDNVDFKAEKLNDFRLIVNHVYDYNSLFWYDYNELEDFEKSFYNLAAIENFAFADPVLKVEHKVDFMDESVEVSVEDQDGSAYFSEIKPKLDGKGKDALWSYIINPPAVARFSASSSFQINGEVKKDAPRIESTPGVFMLTFPDAAFGKAQKVDLNISINNSNIMPLKFENEDDSRYISAGLKVECKNVGNVSCLAADLAVDINEYKVDNVKNELGRNLFMMFALKGKLLCKKENGDPCTRVEVFSGEYISSVEVDFKLS